MQGKIKKLFYKSNPIFDKSLLGQTKGQYDIEKEI